MSECNFKSRKCIKQYRLGYGGTGTIKHDLNRLVATISGKEDPFLKIGEQMTEYKRKIRLCLGFKRY